MKTMLFNPYTGKPRDPRDIASDPAGALMVDPDEPLLAAPAAAAPAIVSEILAELARATRKFPTWPTDPLHALTVVGEEFGELTKDMLQLCYEPHKSNRDKVRTEALQTAAMALRLAMSLERYEYKAGPQHSQAETVTPQQDTSKGASWAEN